MKSQDPISAVQIRAGRGLLGWSARQLAEHAGVSLPTVQRFEWSDGIPESRGGTLARVRSALEAAGVVFIGDPLLDPGVQLTRGPASRAAGS